VTIKIYGPAASRAARALWIVHELGVPFEHVAMEMKDLKNPDYLHVNPNGKVPALVDGDFKLFESMAINLYLAKRFNKDGFWPASAEDQAVCYQWSFWGMTEVEKPLLTVLIDMFMTAPDKRKPEAVAEAQKALPKPFAVLDAALQGRDYLLGSSFTVADLNLASICSLLGSSFTVADLNLASICSWAKPIKYDFKPFPKASAWLDRCLSRPAYKAARSTK
jgi:glutathione S-transferase